VGKNLSLGINTSGQAAFGSVFSTLQTLRNDLSSGDQTAISADIDKVTTSITTISDQRAAVGSTTNEIADIKTRLTRSQSDYQEAVSNIEDVDLAQAYVQLQSSQNVYQAALATTAQSFKLSLTNYLN
jgi:flagellar hook-associated protein 3 FlgL